MPCMYAGNEDTDPSAPLQKSIRNSSSAYSFATIFLRYGIKFLRYVKINSKFSHYPTECNLYGTLVIQHHCGKSTAWLKNWTYPFQVFSNSPLVMKYIDCKDTILTGCKDAKGWPFARWVILHTFLSSADFFSTSTFSENSCRNTIRMSNSLDPDQARQFVGHDLGSNCL